MLLLLAGEDESVPPVEAESFAAAAEQRGVPCQLVLFPGVPAGFFDRYSDDYVGACTQAWRHVRTFIDRYA
jgi:dienelactone hydrolase